MTTAIRPKKSEKLTSGEKRLLMAWIYLQPTFDAAAKTLNIARSNLYNITSRGSGRPESIKKIRSVINPIASN